MGKESNQVPARDVSEIKEQLLRIRDWLGPAGNVQLTDGEVTLRPEAELLELVAYARGVGLVPMVMTHGETFRRRPGLLERLMEGGLTEISIHIDTTMKGRRGHSSRAACEEDLMALRSEFGGMIRRARRNTGLRLEAASTVTVTRDNLEGVPSIMRWFLKNADAFKMVSFQPAAQVGRTEPGLGGGVSPDDLWTRIAEGVLGSAPKRHELLRGEGWFGHPACSRFVQGLIVRRSGNEPRFHPLYRRDREDEMRFVSALLDRLGGASFRLDGAARAAARVLQILSSHPGFILGSALPYAWRLLERAGGGRAERLLLDWLTGRTEVRYFNIVSHHFMSREEIETPPGQERLSMCAFQVPVHGMLMSMCAVNALGARQEYHARTQGLESLSVQS
ncbi:MAG: hypothetical protein HY924_11295 [Elusimicrobia bacterium]|nr:hypothetical protein [Elusimicrobiota bacterium]